MYANLKSMSNGERIFSAAGRTEVLNFFDHPVNGCPFETYSFATEHLIAKVKNFEAIGIPAADGLFNKNI